MNFQDLYQAMRVFDRYGIPAREITIKGKDSKTISFTCLRPAYDAIAQMCEESEWTFHTTIDQFIARRNDRYQVHLDGRKS